MADTPPDGWESWGKHVLLELQRLSEEVKGVHIALDRVRSDMTQIVQEESLNTDFRVEFCESWRKYRVAIVGALATAAAGIIVQLVLAGMGG